jgi:cyclase
MHRKRIIPCLDIRAGKVTKGVGFKNNVDLGDPAPLARRYYEEGADEIVIYDITASVERRPPDGATIGRIAAEVFVPISIGGGITTLEDAVSCIKSGAEKVSLNSIAPTKPELITQISSHFGVQAVVLSIDVARDTSMPSGYRIFTHGGRTPTDLDALAWVTRAIPLGAGELCVNSIDQDGTRAGYDLDLLGLLRRNLSVPIIVSGGAGSVAHMDEALKAGADAVLVASIVHSGEQTVDGIKRSLSAAGHPMRLI